MSMQSACIQCANADAALNGHGYMELHGDAPPNSRSSILIRSDDDRIFIRNLTVDKATCVSPTPHLHGHLPKLSKDALYAVLNTLRRFPSNYTPMRRRCALSELWGLPSETLLVLTQKGHVHQLCCSESISMRAPFQHPTSSPRTLHRTASTPLPESPVAAQRCYR